MRTIVGVACAAAALIFGCNRDIPAADRGDPGAARKVLIAAADSDFKRAVLDETAAELVTIGCYVKTIGLGGIERADTSPYGAIVLAGSFMAGRLDRRILAYCGKNRGDPRLVVFYTRGGEGPVPFDTDKTIGVDAITAASASDRVKTMAAALIALIRKRLP